MTATAKKKCFVSERKVTPYGQSKGFVRYPLKICGDLRLPYDPCADPENFLGGGGGGGGGGVQIPRRGLTENFNMAKINNLAIITRCVCGGGKRSGPPVTPSGSAHAIGLRIRIGTSTKGRFRNRTMPIRIVNTYVIAHDYLRCLKHRSQNRWPKNRTMIGANVT